MGTVEYLLTKADPRLLDAMIDSSEVDVLVRGPSMLFQRLDFITNLSAFEQLEKYVNQ